MEKFNISGIIGYDFTSKDLSDFLLSNPDKDIYLTINSPGGSVYEAIAIYNLIKNHPANTTIEILGLAASAASFITTAANKVLINPNSVYMLHNAWLISIGDHNKLRDDADYIEKISNLLVNSYSSKSKKTIDEIKSLMDNETFLFGNEIIQYGFADELINQSSLTSQNITVNDDIKLSSINNAKNQLAEIPAGLFENDLLKAAALINNVPDKVGIQPVASLQGLDVPLAQLNHLINKIDSLLNNSKKIELLFYENKFTSKLPVELIDEINSNLINSNKIIPAQAKLIKELFDLIQSNGDNISSQPEVSQLSRDVSLASDLPLTLFVENVFAKLIAILDAKPNSNLLNEFATKPELINQEEETFSFAIVDKKSREIHRQILQLMREKNISYISAAHLLLSSKSRDSLNIVF